MSNKGTSNLTADDWKTLEKKIVDDLKDGVNVSSHSLAGNTFSYRTLTEQKSLLAYCRQRIQEMQGDSFRLTRMLNI